jgi:hypothetical protein
MELLAEAEKRTLPADAIRTILELQKKRSFLPEKVLNVLTDWAETVSTSRDPWGFGSWCQSAGEMHKRFHPASDFKGVLQGDAANSLSWASSKFDTDIPPLLVTVDGPQAAEQVWTILQSWLTRLDGRVEGYKHVPSASKKKNCERKTVNARLAGASFKKCDIKTKKGKQICHPDWRRLRGAVSALLGRLHLWYSPWVTASAAPLAKRGLLHELLVKHSHELLKHPVTLVWIILASSEWSVRKEFTLESQKQGVLNPHLQSILEWVKVHEPSGLRLIAWIFPSREIYASLSKSDLADIRKAWMDWAPHLARFLSNQWKKGVAKCARRQMRVPPSGSGVNSTGWNNVSDAWQNMVRFLQLINAYLPMEDGSPLLPLKVPQLIANDQFMWGQSADKKMPSSVAVFRDLTKAGILPWNAFLPDKDFDFVTAVTTLAKSCSEHKCSLNSWLGVPTVRTTDVVKVHATYLICGIPVSGISDEFADILKTAGVWGAGQWTGK